MASGLGEPLRFVLNGGVATAVHYCVLLVGLEVVALPSAGVANLIASTVGITTSFLGNRYFVFRSREEPLLAQAARFVGLYLSIALVNGAVLYVWTDRLGLNYHIGFVITVALQTIMAYLGGKRLVFLKDRARTAVLRSDPKPNRNSDYAGNELQIFSSAKNWKAYWTREIMPFLGDCILEVGAGIGATAAALNFRTYKKWVALEPDEKLCSVIRGEMAKGALPAGLEVRTGTSRALNPGETFDTILYIDVLEHIEDDGRELAKAAEHLQENGCLVIVAPAHNFLYSEFDRKIGHVRRYDKGMLRSVIPEGLEIRRLRYLDSVGLLASLANRVLLRSDSPTHGQVHLWDRFMVRPSRWLDPLFGYGLGKSIVCVLKKPQGSRGTGEIS